MHNKPILCRTQASDGPNDNTEAENIAADVSPAVASSIPSSLSASKRCYIQNGCSLNALHILCQGLMDDEGNLFIEISVLPCSFLSPEN